MIKHHPSTDLLVEYANGSAPWAVCISIAAHIQMCDSCRNHLNMLEDIGGSSLENCQQQTVSPTCFDSLMSKLSTHKQSSLPNALVSSLDVSEKLSPDPLVKSRPSKTARTLSKLALPKAISKLISNDLQWRKISSSLKSAHLITGQNDFEVCFHRISKGGKVIEHDHKGMEITLVLDGSFSDEDGIYHRGDFLVRQPGDVHRPTATRDHDCLCLSVCEAPVKVTGWKGWIVNPFLSVHPA